MSKIEWTGKTWNPIAGCSIVSPGCKRCYAMKMAWRIALMGTAPHYEGLTKKVNGEAVWTGKIAIAPEHIFNEPLRVQRPTTWFVNSMSDLFHEDVPDEVILRVLDVIRCTSWDGGSNIGKIARGTGEHTYQLLTKRSARMRAFMQRLRWDGERLHLADDGKHPLVMKNLWLGVSAERQQEANERIPDLLATPAAVRFVSAEPLLGPINLRQIPIGDRVFVDALTGCHEGHGEPASDWSTVQESLKTLPPLPERTARIDWVIVGGESGPGARPFDLVWARSIVEQCRIVSRCFVKQVGSHPTDSDRSGLKGMRLITKSKKGGDMDEWPPELRVRQMPSPLKSAEAA